MAPTARKEGVFSWNHCSASNHALSLYIMFITRTDHDYYLGAGLCALAY